MDPFLELASIALDTAESPSGEMARTIVDKIVAQMRESGDDRWDHASGHERRDLLMHALYGVGSLAADLADACPRYPSYVDYLIGEIPRDRPLSEDERRSLRREFLSRPERMM